SGLKALIMPSITLGLFQMTLIMRLVRAEMLEVMRTDYIRFARARGLTTRAIHFGHALRNTLVPVITVAGLQFGSVIAFAIITEKHAAAAPGWFRRALDSDLFYSFRRSKITMIAAGVTLLFFLLAIFASVLSVQNPFDPAQLQLMNSRISPLWTADGQSPFLL